MVQVWHGPPIIILHMRTKWGVITDLSCTSAQSLTTLSAQLRLKAENTLRQSSPQAFLMHHHFEVTEMTPREALWSEVKLSLISTPANDLLRGKNRGKREKEKGRWRIEKDKHIPRTYSLHYERGGGGSRSFNYWLPSQANIPACQGPFWLSFGQSSSDGPHFLLNRTRRCCENGDTWSCVQETGNASARPRACQDTLHTYPSMNPMRVGSRRGREFRRRGL